MPKIGISTGIGPNTLTGDSLLVGASAINSNFNEIYGYFGDGSNLSFVGSVWKSTALGLSTTKSVGINTLTPTSSFHVVGDSLFSGIVTSYSFVGPLTGTATTAINLSNAANITTGTINPNRLTGTYSIDISGIAANASFASQAAQASLSDYSIISGLATQAQYSDLSGISTYSDISGVSTYSGLSGISSYSNISGVSTYSINAGIASLANYATIAGIATLGSNYANISGVSTYSLLAGISSYSNFSGETLYSNLSGVSTYSNISGVSTYSLLSGISTALQSARDFSITGNFISCPIISFDGTNNVSLSATITENSIELGKFTSGNYVKRITNGSYIIGSDGGSEGAELILSVDASISNTPSKVVVRDGLGDFSARVITANLTGTATTATYLADAGNITTGTISNLRLSGNYNINISGSSVFSTYSSSSGISTLSLSSNYSPISGVSTYSSLSGVSTYSNLSGVSTYSNLSGVSTYSNLSGVSTSVIGGISSVSSLSVSGISTFNGISTHTSPIFGTNLTLSGTAEANSFVGSGIGLTDVKAESLSGTTLPPLDGSNLYNIIGVGAGIEIRDNNSTLGTASTINFGDNLNVDFSSGIATITGLAAGNSSQWVSSTLGIHTISSVGIGTTNPTSTLTVDGNAFFTGILTAIINYSSISGVSTYSSISGISSLSLHSNTSGISSYSSTSGISSLSLHSNTSGVSTYSNSSGVSTYANRSGVSTYSSLSGVSTYSSLSGVSTYSNSSGVSTYSNSSGVSTYSSLSGVSTYSNSSDYSNTSGVSTFSNSSLYSNLSGLSTYSNSSDYSNTSGVSTFSNSSAYSIISGISTYSEVSGITTYSNISGVSTYSNLSGVSTYATLSGVSTYSIVSGVSTYSIVSGVSTYSEVSGVSTYSEVSGITTYSNISGVSTYSEVSGVSTYSEISGISTNSFNSQYSLYSEVSGISSSFDGIFGGIDYLNVRKGVSVTSGPSGTVVDISHNSSSPAINIYNQTTDSSTLKVTELGLVGIGSSNPSSKLTVSGNVQVSGILTAGVFIGDGSGLTGIVAQGSGIVIRDDNSLVGTASTINFGENITVSQISSGIVTVSSTNQWSSNITSIYNTQSNIGIGTSVAFSKLHVLGNLLVSDGDISGNLLGNSSSSSYSLSSGIATNTTNSVNVIGGIGSISLLTVSGISTLSSLNVGVGGTIIQTLDSGFVGINSAIPRETLDVSGKLFVKDYSLNTGIGTFIASSGVPFTIDSFAVQTGFEDFKSVEYTINVGHGTNIQTQKVLALQNGTTAYSQEYAIIYHPNLIVSVASTIFTAGSDSFFLLQVIPESGISGLTTYRFVRGGLL